MPFETSLDRLIADHDLDVALVTLPNADAPAAIERLAGAGIHLLVDKPAARSAAELRRPRPRPCGRAGVRAVTGLTRRYTPAARAARDLIASGGLGRLVAAEAIFATSSVAVRDPANLLFDRDRSGGGVLSWLGVHDVDALLWLSGEPIVEVVAMTGSVGHDGLAVEDVASVGVRFAGGAVGTHPRRLRPAGTRLPRTAGAAVASTDRSSWRATTSSSCWPVARTASWPRRARPSRARRSAGYGAQGRAAVADLLGAIREGRETEAPIEALVRALEVIDAAYAVRADRSSRQARWSMTRRRVR